MDAINDELHVFCKRILRTYHRMSFERIRITKNINLNNSTVVANLAAQASDVPVTYENASAL